MIRPASRFALSSLAALVLVSAAPAQTTHTWQAPNTGFTSVATNWDMLPLNNVDTTWVLPGTAGQSYGVLYDFATGYQLNGMNFTSASAGLTNFTIGNLTANTLAFSLSTAGVSPFINMNAVGPAISSNPFAIAHTNFNFGGNGGIFNMNAPFAGAGVTITKTGTSTLNLLADSSSTLTGATVWNLNGGRVNINNSVNQLGSIAGANTVAVNFNGGTLGVTTSGGSAGVARSINFQSGVGTIDIGLIGTTFTLFPITGSPNATFQKAGPGAVSATLASPGMLSDVSVAGGQLLLAIDNGLGTGSAINVLSGATFGLSGAVNFAAGTNRDIRATGTGFVDVASIVNGAAGSGAVISTAAATFNNNLTINGTTSLSGASTLTINSGIAQAGGGPASLIKDGVGQLNLNAAAAYTGSTTIRNGVLSLQGPAGALPNSANSPITIGNLAVGGAIPGRLLIDNTTAFVGDRVGNDNPISFQSGALNFITNPNIGSGETLGPVTLSSGTASITATPAANAGAQLTLTSIARQNRSTAIFRGTALGSTSAVNVSNIFVTGGFASGDLVGNPTATDPTRAIIRWAGGTTAAGTVVNNFLTNDAANGIRFLDATEISSTATINSTQNGFNVRSLTGANVTGDAMINALDIGGFSTAMAANTFLRVSSGLIMNNTTTISLNGTFNPAVLDFGNQEPIFLGHATATLGPYIVSSNGFTRGSTNEGATTTTLAQPNVIRGPITLNGIGLVAGTTGGELGRIQLSNMSVLGDPSNEWVFSGGRMVHLATPSTTFTNTFTINPGGADLNFGAGAADAGPLFTHTGTMRGVGRFTKSGAATLVIAGDNSTTFSGQTAVTAGILSISSANNLGSTGDILMNGGRLLVTGNATFAPGRSVGVNAASTISVDSGATLTFQGVVTGGTGLTKFGPGTLALEGANTGSSSLTVSGSPSPRQPVGVGSTAVLRGVDGYWGGSGITVNAGATLVLDNALANNNHRLRDETAFTMTMAGGTTRIVGNATVPTHELMGVLTFGGTSPVDGARSTISLEPNANTPQQMILSPTSLTRATPRTQYTVRGPIPFGLNTGNYLGTNVANIIPRALPVLAGNPIGTLTEQPILPGAMGLSTLPGAGGPGFMTFNAAAGLRLLDASEYVGTFASGNLTNINVNANAPVAGIDAATTINSLMMQGGAGVSGAGALTITSGTVASLGTTPNSISVATLPFAAAVGGNFFVEQDLTISSQITTTTSGIHKSGAGRLTLTAAANTFTGGIVASGGILSVATDAQLGGTGGGVVLNGATLEVTGATFATVRTINVLANGGVIDIGANNASYGLTGIPGFGSNANAGPVTKRGTGTLTMGSLVTASFNAGFNIEQGNVLFGASNANMSQSTPIVISTGATLTLNGTTAETVGSIEGSGNLVVGGGVTSPTLTVGGVIGTVAVKPEATFAGTISGTAASIITKSGQGDWTLSGSTSDFPGTWNVIGGRLILGANVPNGAAGVTSPLGNATSAISVGQSAATNDGAALLTNGAFTIGRPLTIVTGTGTAMQQPSIIGTLATSGTTTFSGAIGIGTGGTTAKLFQVQAPGQSVVDLTGPISITGAYTGVATLEKVGTGTLLMSNAANTYTGRTVLTSGTLGINASGTPLGASILVVNGGTISAAGANRSLPAANSLLVNNDVTFAGNELVLDGDVRLGFGTRTMTVDSPLVRFNGIVSGATFTGSTFGGLTKAGPGTLVLTNSNTYSGGTTVNDGRLTVSNSAGSGTGGGGVSVNGGSAILGGNGIIAGAVSVTNGGTLRGGASPGILTINNNVTMSNGSIFGADVNGNTAGSGLNQYSQVVQAVTGQLGLNGATLQVASTATDTTFAPTDVVELIKFLATNGTQFGNAPDNTTFTFTSSGLPAGYVFTSTINYGTLALFPNSVTLSGISPVPEPMHILAVGAIGAAGLGWIRKRRAAKKS